MVGGTAIAALLEPWSRPLRAAAVVVLLAIGLRGLVRVWRERRSVAAGVAPERDARASGPSLLSTYSRFLGLTILNPATVVYFAALILALPELRGGQAARIAFVVGAFLASVSWQLVLAALGAVAHHRLPPRFQVGISVLGNAMICGFAVALARALV
jgi:arginine exporter protein ArgO